MQATAGIKYSLETEEPLFSDKADYTHFLEVLASLKQLNIAAYCLLPKALHLLALGQPMNLPDQLLRVLTGDADHPLSRAFRQQFLDRDSLPAALIRLHQQPILAGQTASPAGYRWSSHHCYTGNTPAPAWLALEAFWQTQAVRRASWAKTYAAWLQPGQPSMHASEATIPHAADIGLDQLLTRVLSDFSCSPAQLGHARMRRRRVEIGGIIWAACEHYDLHERNRLCDYFQLSEAILAQAGAQAARVHGQYLHSLTRVFGARAERKSTQASVVAWGQNSDLGQRSEWSQSLSFSEERQTPGTDEDFLDSDPNRSADTIQEPPHRPMPALSHPAIKQ